jgi:transposase
MKQKSGPDKAPAERVIRDFRRATRRQFFAEEKIRIVLEGLRGEESIAEICRREGIASSMYYAWSMEFLGEAESNRSSGSIARQTVSVAWPATPRAPQCPARSKTCDAKRRR